MKKFLTGTLAGVFGSFSICYILTLNYTTNGVMYYMTIQFNKALPFLFIIALLAVLIIAIIHFRDRMTEKDKQIRAENEKELAENKAMNKRFLKGIQDNEAKIQIKKNDRKN